MNGTVTWFQADGVSGDPETTQPAGVEQDATNQPKPSDEELTKRIDEAVAESTKQYQVDMDKQKSALQSTHAAELGNLQKGWESERDNLVSDVRALTLQNLDEDDRVAYQQQFANEDYRRLEKRVEDAEARATANAQVGPYLQGAAELGLDITKFDLANPSGSLWGGVTELISGLKEENERLQKFKEEEPATTEPTTPAPVTPTTTPTTPSTITPSPVLTTQHSTPSGAATLGSVRKALSTEMGREVSLDELFTLAEQRPDLEQRLRELSQQGSE